MPTYSETGDGDFEVTDAYIMSNMEVRITFNKKIALTDPAVVDFIEQTNSREITVYFDQPMVGDGIFTGTFGTTEFDGYEIDEDDKSIVYFATKTIVTDGTDLEMNLSAVTTLMTLGGANAEDIMIAVVTVTFGDVPVVVSVEAIYNNEIEVGFDQDMAIAGEYYIFEEGADTGDNSNAVIGNADVVAVIDGDTITVTWSAGDYMLTGGEIYTVKIIGAENYDGQTIGANEFDFIGADTPQVAYITGVEIIAANAMNVSTTEEYPVVESVEATNTTSGEVEVLTDEDLLQVYDDNIKKVEVTIATGDHVWWEGEDYTLVVEGIGSFTFSGLLEMPEPLASMYEILDFFDSAVEDETLTGKENANNLRVFGKKLHTVKKHIEAEKEKKGICNKLEEMYKKVDGEPGPDDFVTGDAADALAAMILDLIECLEVQDTVAP